MFSALPDAIFIAACLQSEHAEMMVYIKANLQQEDEGSSDAAQLMMDTML